MKKKKNVMYRKSVSLLAAAAMTAVLMTGQVYPVAAWGQSTETRLEKSSLIPENITIDQPVALSEVALPRVIMERFPGRMIHIYRIKECRPAK